MDKQAAAGEAGGGIAAGSAADPLSATGGARNVRSTFGAGAMQRRHALSDVSPPDTRLRQARHQDPSKPL